jgi:hypothetical protein
MVKVEVSEPPDCWIALTVLSEGSNGGIVMSFEAAAPSAVAATYKP